MRATFISMIKEPLESWLNSSILGRAKRNKIISTDIIYILDHVKNHHDVDDTPYGGGAGELMRIDVIAPLIKKALITHDKIKREQKRVILLDPSGPVFNQTHAKRLTSFDELIFVCGRFEGIDARVYNYVDETLSLGDFVMSCGELAALCILDATARLVLGVLGNENSLLFESHINGRLESSNFTRPALYENLEVPSVFQSGNHKLINQARKKESVIKTAKLRPDLLEKFPGDCEELSMLKNSSTARYFWQKLYE